MKNIEFRNEMQQWVGASPGDPAGFHVVGQRDVIRPDVKLPFVDAEDAAEHRSWVDPDAHIEIHLAQFKKKKYKTKTIQIGPN